MVGERVLTLENKQRATEKGGVGRRNSCPVPYFSKGGLGKGVQTWVGT